MTAFNPRLLTPPQTEDEIYPYRRAWRSIVIEIGIFLCVAVAIYVLVTVIEISIPESFNLRVDLLLALLPLALWLYFSWWQERRVPQPRQRLLATVLLSGLVAHAVGTPLVIDFLQTERWLPLSSAIDRIMGYTFTVGIVQETLKYLVLRYTVWPDCFRTRFDGVAYGAAVGLGYATALNLEYVLTTTPLPQIAVLRFLATLVIQIPTGVLIGYGLSELRFGLPSPFLGMITIGLTALLNGLSIPLQSGLINTTLSLGFSVPRELLGIVFSIGVFISMLFGLSFLYINAERQASEARAEREE